VSDLCTLESKVIIVWWINVGEGAVVTSFEVCITASTWRQGHGILQRLSIFGVSLKIPSGKQNDEIFEMIENACRNPAQMCPFICPLLGPPAVLHPLKTCARLLLFLVRHLLCIQLQQPLVCMNISWTLKRRDQPFGRDNWSSSSGPYCTVLILLLRYMYYEF
jgi:hypothetical protein